MNWIVQSLAEQGRVGQDQTELGRVSMTVLCWADLGIDAWTRQKSSGVSRAQQDWVAQNRTGQGCWSWVEQGRGKQGWAGLDKTGQV